MSSQIAANIWNEYFDFKSGLDLNQAAGNSGTIVREGISPQQVKLGYIFSSSPLVLGIFLGIASILVVIAGRRRLYSDQLILSGGPKPISRTPFGELASGVAMGFAIVYITPYTWTGTLYWDFLIPAIPSTILIGNIMMTNNLRDFSNGIAHGRRTLVILLGKDEGIRLLRTLFIVCVLWLFLWVFLGHLPSASLLGIIALFRLLKALSCKRYADVVKNERSYEIYVHQCDTLSSVGKRWTVDWVK